MSLCSKGSNRATSDKSKHIKHLPAHHCWQHPCCMTHLALQESSNQKGYLTGWSAPGACPINPDAAGVPAGAPAGGLGSNLSRRTGAPCWLPRWFNGRRDWRALPPDCCVCLHWQDKAGRLCMEWRAACPLHIPPPRYALQMWSELLPILCHGDSRVPSSNESLQTTARPPP